MIGAASSLILNFCHCNTAVVNIILHLLDQWSKLTCIPSSFQKKTTTNNKTAFDPQPHIENLEHALSLLLPLRKANALKCSELERSVASAERAYRGDVRGAKAGFEVCLFLCLFWWEEGKLIELSCWLGWRDRLWILNFML